MLKINVTHNFPQVSAAIASAKKQVPFALARALTKVGQDVKEAQQKEIAKVFDRPTRYTRNSVFLRAATKARPEAEVWLKWGKRPDHYLLPQIVGGLRPQTRFEERMRKTGYITFAERLVPTSYAPLDAEGNIGRGTVTKILSQLKTAVVLGDFSNATDSKASKRKRAEQEFFWSAGPGTSYTYNRTFTSKSGAVTRRMVTARRQKQLKRGVWMVRRFAFGNALVPIFMAVPRASYRQRYDFFGVADRVFKQRFQAHWDESWAIAMKTARLSTQTTLF